MERYLIRSAAKNVKEGPSCSSSKNSSDASQLSLTPQQVPTEEEIHEQPKKKRIRIFREQWLELFPWLEDKEGSSFCKVCQKALINLKPHLERHQQLEIHKRKLEEKKNQVVIENFMDEKKRSLAESIRNVELTLIMFCLMHHLPFSLMDYLPDLLRKCCPDSNVAKHVQCGRTKATKITKTILGKKGQEEVASALRGSKFSLIVDETTDISCAKALVLVARMFDRKKCEVRDRFLGILQLSKCNSESIFNAITDYLTLLKIPLSNLIGLATDDAAVMTGELKGLQARFKEINPNIFVMKCICHSMHLCANYACKKLPTAIENLAKSICNFFAHSAKRNHAFAEFQDFLALKPHRILRLSQTRWLSFESVVNRILEQWSALKLFFISTTLENDSFTGRELAEKLDNPENKIYFLFLSYILKIVNAMNIEFQSGKLRIHILYSVMETNYKTILSNFIKPSAEFPTFEISKIDILDESCYLDLNEIYMGSKVEQFLATTHISALKLNEIKRSIQQFYIELAVQIRKRFDFNNATLKQLMFINPLVAINSTDSITQLLKTFSNILEEDSEEAVSTEWRALKYSSSFKTTTEEKPEEFWAKLGSIKNALGQPIYSNVSRFMLDLMSLPHSSAAAERKFSDLNLIKNKNTNRLDFETIQAIMASKELLESSNPKYIWTPSI